MAHNMFVGSGKRSGTRGGADQFSWDKVKGDKYKDFYLGHSLHTTAKPTFNNRKPNPLWWTKSQSGAADDEARRRSEIEAIKREEEQLHLEALGLAPRRRKAQENQLDATEIQELTRRGNTERDAYDAERVAGLGYAPAPQHQLDTEGGLVDLKRTDDKEQEGGAGEREAAAAAAGHGRTGDKEEEWVEVKSERNKKRSKEERREDKQQRKEEKMKDKKEKRERKGRKDKHRADRHTAVDSDRRREHRRDHEGGDHKRPHHDRHSNNTEAPERQHQPYRRHRHRESVRSPARSPSPKRVRRHDSPSPPRSRYSRSS